jgi:hypothetical protein
MSLDTTQISTTLFKKSVGKGTTSVAREFFEEPQNGRMVVLPDQVWREASLIPLTAPVLLDGTTLGVVRYHEKLALIPVPGLDNSFTAPEMIDAIPFNFGDGSYNYAVFDQNDVSIPFGQGDWIFDNEAGTFTFYGAVPADLPPRVSFYRYVGAKGVGGGSGPGPSPGGLQYVDVNLDYTVQAGDNGFMLRVNASQGELEILLPEASSMPDGFYILITKVDTSLNPVQVRPADASDTLAGYARLTISAFQQMMGFAKLNNDGYSSVVPSDPAIRFRETDQQVDFSTAVANVEDRVINLLGVEAGDRIALAVPNDAMVPGQIYVAWVSALDTITIRAINLLGIAAAPVASFGVTVIKKP